MNAMLRDIFFWGFTADAVIIMTLGAVVAFKLLLGKEVTDFMWRAGKAIGVLVGASLAAGIIMWVATKAFLL